MDTKQFAQILDWVTHYADSYITRLSEKDALPLVLKRAHTLRVADDCGLISSELGWNEDDVLLGKAVGLLHDIARFEQYSKFNTFVDAVSFDHGDRAASIAHGLPILDDLTEGERSLILTAVRFHNRRTIPSDINPDELRFLQLIRDADKIDILHSISMVLKNGWHLQHPGILLDVDLDGPVNPKLVEEILETKSGGYENVRSLADMHLMRITWMHSVNFRPSLRIIVDRSLCDEPRAMLPDTPEIAEICRRAFAHVQSVLGSG